MNALGLSSIVLFFAAWAGAEVAVMPGLPFGAFDTDELRQAIRGEVSTKMSEVNGIFSPIADSESVRFYQSKDSVVLISTYKVLTASPSEFEDKVEISDGNGKFLLGEYRLTRGKDVKRPDPKRVAVFDDMEPGTWGLATTDDDKKITWKIDQNEAFILHSWRETKDEWNLTISDLAVNGQSVLTLRDAVNSITGERSYEVFGSGQEMRLVAFGSQSTSRVGASSLRISLKRSARDLLPSFRYYRDGIEIFGFKNFHSEFDKYLYTPLIEKGLADFVKRIVQSKFPNTNRNSQAPVTSRVLDEMDQVRRQITEGGSSLNQALIKVREWMTAIQERQIQIIDNRPVPK